MLRNWCRRLATAGLILIWVCLTLSRLWPALARRLDDTPSSQVPADGSVNYLVVAPESLGDAARLWAAYRQERGYAAGVHLAPPDEATADHVRAAIQEAYAQAGQPYPFHVLLLGHAHPDSSFPATYLPADRVPVPPQLIPQVRTDHIASDSGYAFAGDPYGSSFPMAIGRVPARTHEEAVWVLERTQDYEAHPPSGEERVQVELVASDPQFGQTYNQLIEALVTFMAEDYMPAEYRWHMVWGNPLSPYGYPPDTFPSEAARRLDSGALLVTFIAHGSSDWLGPAISTDGWWGRIFGSADLALIEDASGSLVAMIACSSGEYDTPGDDPSLAEALVLQSNGPIATYAASRITSPAANTILGKDLFQGLLADQEPTVGEWIWRAESNYGNPGAHRTTSMWMLAHAVPVLTTQSAGEEHDAPPQDIQDVYAAQLHAYNLFGDPALAPAYPLPDLEIEPRHRWQPFGEQLSFSGEGDLEPGQLITVTLDAPAGTILATDDEWETIIERYVQANAKTVSLIVLTVGPEGRFEGTMHLPPGLPGGAYILKAVAVDGPVTHVGAHPVTLGAPPLGEVLSSTGLWWLAVSGLILCRIIRREPLRRAGRHVQSDG